MIDIENQVFTKIALRLRTDFPNIYVSGELNLTPARFPSVFIEEADNCSLNSTRDTASNDNHAILMYEVNVFSNKTSGKKTEAKAIYKVIDEVFNDLGFTRQNTMPITFADSSVYRISGRYTAIADKNERIFRR